MVSLKVGEIPLCGLHLITFCRGCNSFLYLLAFSPHIFTIWAVLHTVLCSVMPWNQLYLALKVEMMFSVICIYTSWASGVILCLYSQGLFSHPVLAFPATVMTGANFWSFVTCLCSPSRVSVFGWLSPCYDPCLGNVCPHTWCLCPSSDSSFKLFNPICIAHSSPQMSMFCSQRRQARRPYLTYAPTICLAIYLTKICCALWPRKSNCFTISHTSKSLCEWQVFSFFFFFVKWVICSYRIVHPDVCLPWFNF